MPEKTWLETRKKRKGKYVLVFLILVVAGLAVFVRNNREMFFPQSDGTKQKAVILISDSPKVVPKDELKSEPKNGPASGPEKTQAVSDMKEASAAGTAKEADAIGHETTGSKKTALKDDRPNVKKLPTAPDMARVASSVLLPDIQCALSDRGALRVVLSLELFMADDSFKREILLKRENLKIMVQKVIAAKTIDELIVDSLRSQTKTAMNKLLEKSMITDVEFRDFRIDKAQ